MLIHHCLGAALEHMVKYLCFFVGRVCRKAGIAKFETFMESLRQTRFIPQMSSSNHEHILRLDLLLNQKLILEVFDLPDELFLGRVGKWPNDVSESTSQWGLQ